MVVVVVVVAEEAVEVVDLGECTIFKTWFNER